MIGNGAVADKVVVVGAGVIGLSCAWQLARRGAGVTVFEKGRRGSGASGAALGALWPPAARHEGTLQKLHRESLWQFQEFVRQVQDASGLRISYLRQGKLELLASPRAVAQAEAETVAANASWPPLEDGRPVMEVLTRRQALALAPQVQTREYGATLCRRTAQVDMAELLAGLTQACQRAGVEIYEATAVERLALQPGQVAGVYVHGELKPASAVLLCAGVETGGLGGTVSALAPIKPIKGQALLLRSQAPLLDQIVKSGKIFVVPWPDGRLLVGSTTEPQAGFDLANTAEGVAWLLQGAAEICPKLKATKLERIWAGLRPAGPGKRPIMGIFPGVPNLYICGGHYKTGVGMAPLVGEWMAQLILTGRMEPHLGEFAPGVPA